MDNLKCLGIAYLLIGSIKSTNLLFAVQNQFIGQIPSDQTDLNVYLIKKVTLIDLNADFDNLLNNNDLFDNCPVHVTESSQDEQQPTSQTFDNNLSSNVQSIQKTWNRIKTSTAVLMNTAAPFNLNDEILNTILKMFNETDSFYYCENGDLTNTLQRKHTSQYQEQFINKQTSKISVLIFDLFSKKF